LMTAFFIWLLAMGGIFLMLMFLGLRESKRHGFSTPADEFHEAPTVDGWLIGLTRYKPASSDVSGSGNEEKQLAGSPGGAPGSEPVLMCHGLMSNRFSFDLGEEASIARYLRNRGFDVWLMELRAHGRSRPDPAVPGRASSWSIDDHIRTDLPAAVRKVLDITGRKKLQFIGHSLGGMILYAHCREGETSWFRSAITIDAPGYFGNIRLWTWPVRLYARIIPTVPIVAFKPLAHFLYVIVPGEALRRRIMLGRERLVKAIYNALVNFGSSTVLLQICRGLSAGRFQSLDGRINYEEGPRNIHFPLMILRAVSGLAPEASVRHAFETAPARGKKYVRLSRESGFEVNHNHFTPLLGSTAPRDTYPLIAEWLQAHARDGTGLEEIKSGGRGATGD
jgi:pimeloyl-ACP methyl ester carboxylesterase